MEFYQGSGPAGTHFIDPAGCGVILVWTCPLDERDRYTHLRFGIALGIAGFMMLITSLL